MEGMKSNNRCKLAFKPSLKLGVSCTIVSRLMINKLRMERNSVCMYRLSQSPGNACWATEWEKILELLTKSGG